MKIKRAWLTPMNDQEDLFSLSLRYDQEDFFPSGPNTPWLHLRHHEVPAKREIHASLGLLDVDDLILLRAAIEKALTQIS